MIPALLVAAMFAVAATVIAADVGPPPAATA